MVLLFWLLNIGFTSANEGSFTPVGVAVQTLYSCGTQIVQMLLPIRSAVDNFIKF